MLWKDIGFTNTYIETTYTKPQTYTKYTPFSIRKECVPKEIFEHTLEFKLHMPSKAAE